MNIYNTFSVVYEEICDRWKEEIMDYLRNMQIDMLDDLACDPKIPDFTAFLYSMMIAQIELLHQRNEEFMEVYGNLRARLDYTMDAFKKAAHEAFAHGEYFRQAMLLARGERDMVTKQ